MGDFEDYLGQYLDNTIVQLAKISSACEIFADKCVLNGYVPPHPGDLQRALKEVNLPFAISNTGAPQSQNNTTAEPQITNANIPDAQQNNIETDEPTNQVENEKEKNSLTDSLKDVPNEDKEIIKEMAKQQKNALSQFTINKIHKRVPNVSTKEIRNYIRYLVAQGEITLE